MPEENSQEREAAVDPQKAQAWRDLAVDPATQPEEFVSDPAEDVETLAAGEELPSPQPPDKPAAPETQS